MPDRRSSRRTASDTSLTHPWLPPLLLFVSGAVALVYEVVWMRQFALVFGAGAPAAAAVLAAYFSGLGLGAWSIGRLASRWPRPLRAYAVIEVLVGVGALLVTPGLALFARTYPAMSEALGGQPAGVTALRVGAAFATLFIPTFCMGGTLPLLGGFVDRQRQRLGLTAGWLYVVNTIGAALGALSVPFVLLPRLGLEHTIWLCATVNALLAIVAWRFDRPQTDIIAEPVATVSRHLTLPAEGRAVLLLAAASGFVTFALQVLWNRAFALVHENAVHSFAVIAAVVILALAVGAQAARIALRREADPLGIIGRAWLAGGIATVLGPGLFLHLTDGLAYLSESGEGATVTVRLVLLAGIVVFVPTALLGVALPALMEQTGRNGRAPAAPALGRLLAVNIGGAVAGALVAGFVLPARFGLWNGILWLGLIVAGLGGWTRWPRRGVWIAAVTVLGLLPLSRLDLPRVRLAADTSERLLAITEGAHGIVAVTEVAGARRLKLNNHYVLGGTNAIGDERLQAHVPLLLHPAPRRVAFLGLGTGISMGGAAFHPVERITAIELVPEVVAAARRHFAEANAGILDDPRTKIIADDARNYLRSTREKFDVIVGDLVVPWRPGEGALFTREQFAAVHGALAPGGLFCQWVPLFQLSDTQFTILLRTFLEVFPHAQVWRGDYSPTAPAFALIATLDGAPPDPIVVRRRLAELQADPANPQLRWSEAFWMNLLGLMDWGMLPAAETRVNSEDRPWIEILGPVAGDAFVGRRLQVWVDRLAIASRPPADSLTESERAAVTAGGVLAELTLSLQENNRAGFLSAQTRLRELLPPDLYRNLFP